MKRAELLKGPLAKLGVIEGRNFTTKQAAAWFEILGEHTPADATAAVLAFHSKPFKRHAYPGDIKALILEIEGVRLRRCGSIEANEEELPGALAVAARAHLRRLIATGDWSPEVYRTYKRSGLKLDEFLMDRGDGPARGHARTRVAV